MTSVGKGPRKGLASAHLFPLKGPADCKESHFSYMDERISSIVFNVDGHELREIFIEIIFQTEKAL